MSNKLNIDLDKANAELNGKTAEEIIAWALAQGSKSYHHDQLSPLRSGIIRHGYQTTS